MTQDYAGRCGLYCGDCEYREKTNCPGCVKMGGKMFWGQCPLAICCNEKGLDHCDQCPDFPCENLTKFAYDKEHENNGERLANLKAWNRDGFEKWLKNKGQQ